DKLYWGLDFRHNLDLVSNATGQYSTQYCTQHTMDIIANHNQTQPLFLYVAYQSVHGANHYARLQAPQDYIKKFSHIQNKDRRTFAALAHDMDRSIGLIMNALSR